MLKCTKKKQWEGINPLESLGYVTVYVYVLSNASMHNDGRHRSFTRLYTLLVAFEKFGWNHECLQKRAYRVKQYVCVMRRYGVQKFTRRNDIIIVYNTVLMTIRRDHREMNHVTTLRQLVPFFPLFSSIFHGLQRSKRVI